MDSATIDKLKKILNEYQAKYPSDAQTIIDAVQKGGAVTMFNSMYKDLKDSSNSKTERKLKNTRFVFFVLYCIYFDNGIPILELISDRIDTKGKKEIISAVKTQETLVKALIRSKNNLENLSDYIYKKEILEYATNEEHKSTGVLKRIIDREKVTNEVRQTPKQSDDTTKTETRQASEKQNKGYSSKEWCAILYFSDYSEKRGTEHDTEIIKSFHKKHSLNYAEKSFIQNFKVVKKYIENNEKQSIRLIEKILPFFLDDKGAADFIETQLSIIKDELDRN